MSGQGRKLNILWLWPDILNLHGDRGNVMALCRVCGLYGVEPIVTRVQRLSDMFWLESADIVLLGAGELSVMPKVTGALSKQYQTLKNYAESGGLLLATGTSGAALGVRTLREDGSHIFGLGLLDMECKERAAVLGDDLIFRLSDGFSDDFFNNLSGYDHIFESGCMDVYGLQIQMMDTSLADGQKPFGQVVYGYGNNGGGVGGAEGAAKDGVIFTNGLGPLLVKNPWLTLALIRRALARRTPGLSLDALRYRPELFEIERASAAAIRKFNETKERPKYK